MLVAWNHWSGSIEDLFWWVNCDSGTEEEHRDFLYTVLAATDAVE